MAAIVRFHRVGEPFAVAAKTPEERRVDELFQTEFITHMGAVQIEIQVECDAYSLLRVWPEDGETRARADYVLRSLRGDGGGVA